MFAYEVNPHAAQMSAGSVVILHWAMLMCMKQQFTASSKCCEVATQFHKMAPLINF